MRGKVDTYIILIMHYTENFPAKDLIYSEKRWITDSFEQTIQKLVSFDLVLFWMSC